jgi:hypothetical protein
MIRGYAPIKGNVRRPRRGATVYRRPELAVVFGALEANPGSALFEGTVSEVPSPDVWQAGLLVKATFTADPQQRVAAPAMSDAQRLAFALACYEHLLPRLPAASPAVPRWREWAQAWLGRSPAATTDLAAMLEGEWPSPGLGYLVRAAYQMASGTVLGDRTPTLIAQGMTDLVRIASQHALQIEDDALAAIVQQSRAY